MDAGIGKSDEVESLDSRSRTSGSGQDAWPGDDRRSGRDRRRRPTRFWDVLLHPGRRQHGRRAGETRDIYVDVYHPRDVLLLLAVLLLNVLDAALTLAHLQGGGSEANPLMARLIQAGEETFLFEKSVVVGVWLVLLVAHKHFVLARAGLFFLLALYFGLFLFHIYIISLS